MTCRHAALIKATGGKCPICDRARALRLPGPTDFDAVRAIPSALALDEVTGLRDVRRDAMLNMADRAAARVVAEQEARAERAEDKERDLDEELAELREKLRRIESEIAESERMVDLADAASLARDFRSFVRAGWHDLDASGRPFAENPGTDAICEHLQALGDGTINLLGIAASPGLGKSTLASIAYPAWMWARNPAWRVICASYAFELARVIGGKFHAFVTGDWYRATFPHVDVIGDALKAIVTSDGGARYAVGVEGALTGLRAEGGVIDDSLNAIDGENKKAIAAVNNWFDTAFVTRFDRSPGREPAIAVIQQRFSENDLIARVRDLGGEVLELPARFDPKRRSVTSLWADPRTEEGELLCPEIHSAEHLDKLEKSMGSRAFAAQYGQRPTPKGGQIFLVGNWSWCAIGGDGAPRVRPEGARVGNAHVLERRRDGSLELDNAVLSIDASGGSTSEDASALGIGLIAARHARRFVLRDFTRGPAGWTETLRRVEAAIRASSEILGIQRKLIVLLEKKAMGASEDAPLPTQLRSMFAGDPIRPDGSEFAPFVWPDGSDMICELVLYEPTGKGDKVTRAKAMEPDQEAGLVHLLDGEPWIKAYVDELASFGAGGTRDDRVDYTSQAIDYLRAPNPADRFRAMSRGLRGVRR